MLVVLYLLSPSPMALLLAVFNDDTGELDQLRWEEDMRAISEMLSTHTVHILDQEKDHERPVTLRLIEQHEYSTILGEKDWRIPSETRLSRLQEIAKSVPLKTMRYLITAEREPQYGIPMDIYPYSYSSFLSSSFECNHMNEVHFMVNNLELCCSSVKIFDKQLHLEIPYPTTL